MLVILWLCVLLPATVSVYVLEVCKEVQFSVSSEYMRCQEIRIGSLNVRGLRTDVKKESLANDLEKYKLSCLAIQETHIKETDYLDLNGKYKLFVHGDENSSHAGVGFAYSSDFPCTFDIINTRIVALKTTVDKKKFTILNGYAPTLITSEKDPKVRENFYDDLDNYINTVPKSHVLIICGDFNAKIGTLHSKLPNHIGKYGKGTENTNGVRLAETIVTKNLIASNTVFQHKYAHVTTWQTTHKNKKSWNGEPRKNPIRNQIDFILVRRLHMKLITNSRSYSGIYTDTDHSLVMAKMSLNWVNIRRQKASHKALDVQKLKDPNILTNYQNNLNENLNEENFETEDAAQQWEQLKKSMKNAAATSIGYKEQNGKRSNDEQIVKLSLSQKQLREKILQSKNLTEIDELRKKRNDILNQIHKRLNEINDSRIKVIAEEIENTKDDSSRHYRAIRILQNFQPHKKLIVQGIDGMITDPYEQAQAIAEFFRDGFNDVNAERINKAKPHCMNPPFTLDEIKSAARSLKNNKSPGIDEINSELLKYGTDALYESIAIILNNIAETGVFPKDLQKGILIPLPKPGKKRGPIQNLRPLMLLTIIRKILAICMLNRIFDRLHQYIPKSQAAYQPGRSTTELVQACKILAEKAISSADYSIYILLMDMSKAFDSVGRKTLLNYIEEILNPDEIHMISILLEDLQISEVDKEENVKDGNDVVDSGLVDIEEELQDELCKLWDMSMNQEVVKYLQEFKAVDILIGVLTKTRAPRIAEISLGVLGNMVCHSEIRKEFSQSEKCRRVLVLLFETTSDVPTLVEASRVLRVCLECSESRLSWLREIETSAFFNALLFIFESSTNSNLIRNTADIIDIAMDKDPPLCTAWSTVELVTAVLEALKQVGFSADSTKVLFHILTLVRSTINEDGKSALNHKSEEVFSLACDYLDNICSFQAVTLENNETTLASCFNILAAIITDGLDLVEKNKRILRCALKILEVLDQALCRNENVPESTKFKKNSAVDKSSKTILESNLTDCVQVSSEEIQEKTSASSLVTKAETVNQTSAEVLAKEVSENETCAQTLTKPSDNKMQHSSEVASSELVSPSITMATQADLGLLNVLHEQVSAFLGEIVLLLPMDTVSPVLEAIDSNKESRLRILAKTLQRNFPTASERIVSILNLETANLPTLLNVFGKHFNTISVNQ